MKIKKRWLAFFAVVIAAIITAASSYFSNSSKEPTVVQKNNGGTNNNAGRDNNTGNRDIINADSVTVNNTTNNTNVTNNIRDTSAVYRRKVLKGDSYNIYNNNQSGGIFVARGNVNIYFAKEAIGVGKNNDKVEAKDNFVCEVDTAKNLITVWPKSGAWQSFFFGVPAEEQSEINPHFGNKANIKSGITKEVYEIEKDKVFALNASDAPATPDFFYTLHYEKLPSYIVFGSYPKTLLKVKLSGILKK